MKKITLSLTLLLMVIGVIVGLNLVSKNQNLQNRAYDSRGVVPCSELFSAYQKYCYGQSVSGVSCVEIKNAMNQYCASSTTPSPNPTPTIFVPTRSPTPTSAQTVCKDGQVKCLSRMILICKSGKWTYLRTCPDRCLNGSCLPVRTID